MDIANPALRKRKRRRLLIMTATAALVLGGAAIGVASLGPALPDVDRSSIWIDTVQRGDMLIEVRATGTLEPRESRWVASSTTAQVEQILFRPGATVGADTVLMRLSNPEVQDELRNATAQVVEAKADVAAKRTSMQSQLLNERSSLAQARADYESAKIKADAEGPVAAKGIIPAVQYKQSMIALQALKYRLQIEQQRVAEFGGNIRAQLATVQAKLEQQRSNLILRQRQADALNVRAGIAGVLQEVAVQEGQQVAAGANLARVARPDILIARLHVPEMQAKDVTLGMPVSVDTHNGLIQGTVARIDPAVRDGSVLIDVDLTGKLPPGARPDLSVEGRIRIAELHNVLSMGRPALGQKNSDITLFRLDPHNGIATRVPVRLGAASVDRVQVLRGLAAGDRVILSDTSQWDKFDRIRVQ